MAQRGRPQRKQRSRFADQSGRSPTGRCRVWPAWRPLTVDVDVPAHDVVELAELPLLLTIRQAAKVLDVCPAKAYEMAHRYEATGCDGLPVIRLDKLYRVPRWAFAVLVLTGRVVTLAELEAHGQQVLEQLSGQPAASPAPAVVEPDAATSFAFVWPAGWRSWPPFVRSVVAPVRSSSSGCSRGTRSSCSRSLVVRPIGFCRQVPVWAIGCRV